MKTITNESVLSMVKNKYKTTAATLYLGTFIMQGISMSILAQYKVQLAGLWKCNIADVLSLISIVNLGALLFTLLVGPISDKYGRKVPEVIGNIFQGLYYLSLITIPFLRAEKIIAFFLYGIGNTFSYVVGSATILEIFPKKASSANVMVKFLISLGQFILPIFILIVSMAHLNFKVLFILASLIYFITALILSFSKFPERQKQPEKQKIQIKSRVKVTPMIISLLLIGYTSCATFNLWTNTYQELARSYGISQPGIIESVYAVAGAISVLITSWIVAKGVRESLILTVYPVLTGLSLALEIIIPKPWIMYPAAFLIGIFAAGGLYQLCTALLAKAMPQLKATVIALAQFMSLVGNTSIIFFAAQIVQAFGESGYKLIVVLNIAVAFIGGLFGLVVLLSEKKRDVVKSKHA